ncbi:MAG: hypothetical protein ACRC26_06870 [Bacteroidales bacterium]
MLFLSCTDSTEEDQLYKDASSLEFNTDIELSRTVSFQWVELEVFENKSRKEIVKKYYQTTHFKTFRDSF